MSYRITARVYQTNPTAYFRIAEMAVLTRGSWSVTDDEYALTMDNSGTSGTLRFLADNGENFLVALGVHNSRRWCDIVTNLTNEQTAVLINPQYYVAGARATQRERQLTTYSVRNSRGRTFTVNYTVTEGNNLRCNIVIG